MKSAFFFLTLLTLSTSQAQSFPVPKKPIVDCVSERKDLATGHLEALEIVYQQYTPDIEAQYAWHIADTQYNLKFNALENDRLGVELVTSQSNEKNLWEPSALVKDRVSFQTNKNDFVFIKEMPISEKYSLVVECR